MCGGRLLTSAFALFAAVFAQHAEFARQGSYGLYALVEALGLVVAHIYIK